MIAKIMTHTHRMYSDESGHTADDLAHSSQHFFVYSFVTLNASQLGEIESEIPKIVKSIFSNDPPSEVKFSKLGGTTKGKRAVVQICKLIGRTGAHVHLAVLEKKFQICAMVVETFFDPKYHPQSPPEWEASNWRKDIANHIYDACPDKSLVEFLAAVKLDDEDSIRKCGEAFASLLKLHPSSQASQAGILMERGLSRFYRFGMRVEDTPKHAERPASAVVALVPALAHINAFLEERNMTVELVCDVTKQFGPVLDWAIGLAKDAMFVSEVSSEFGYTQPLGRILRRTEILASENDAGIQCADLVAGLVNYKVLGYRAGQAPDSILSDAWDSLKPCVALAEPAHFEMMSKKMLGYRRAGG
nr:DUF3800 domain-containing protein [Myxococcus sp. AM011]